MCGATPAASYAPPSPPGSPPQALGCLLQLSRRASFLQLGSREVALADAFNADYLSQLFIKGDTRRLDTQLLQVGWGGGEAEACACGVGWGVCGGWGWGGGM